MSLGHGVLITRTNLKMLLDPANAKSYPGSGSAITDITRNGFNGTLQNSPTFSTTNGGILTFNGTNQYVQGSGFPIVPGTVYTKNVWFNLAATADNNLISSDNGGHFMYFSGSSKMYCGHTDWGNYQAYQSTASFSNGVWYNACLTFSTTNGFSLYINGVLDSTQLEAMVYEVIAISHARGGAYRSAQCNIPIRRFESVVIADEGEKVIFIDILLGSDIDRISHSPCRVFDF